MLWHIPAGIDVKTCKVSLLMNTSEQLLSRDEFRESVFERDSRKCVVCGREATAAHHILERKLFDNGGYYTDNGVSLCDDCHLKAEACILTCEELRVKAGIISVILPPCWEKFPEQRLSKWGDGVDRHGNVTHPGPLHNTDQFRKAWLLRYKLHRD